MKEKTFVNWMIILVRWMINHRQLQMINLVNWMITHQIFLVSFTYKLHTYIVHIRQPTEYSCHIHRDEGTAMLCTNHLGVR